MPKNPLAEFILDRLASGSSFKQLKGEYNISKTDLITAALYGISELRGEYITLLARRKKK